MEIYENEHDQVDAIKRFFVENGKALVVGVILGVGALIGWRYWNNHQLSKGDIAGARKAWQAGVDSKASPALSEMMQMKINNLSV